MTPRRLWQHASPQARSPRRRLAWLAFSAAIAAAAAGCGAVHAGPAASAPATVIPVTAGACGGAWHLSEPGFHTFTIRNNATQAAEVYLTNPANGAIYAEVAAMGPGTHRPMALNVGSGSYAFLCVLDDLDPIKGPPEKVPGHERGAAAILPVGNNDLLKPASEYHAYVTSGLKVLARQTRTLVADIKAGKLASARTAWLPAHLTYERLGAAYDAFGDFDGEIGTNADGLNGGVHSPGFTGFYRLEYGLWHGQTGKQLTGPASKLLQAVLGLQAAWPSSQIEFLSIGLRTHEILENALQFQLSGHDDYGSGTTLATTAANIAGTRELLTVLHPLLVARYTGLPAVNTWLNTLQSRLGAQHSKAGHWIAAHQLSRAARERIDAAASQALQELAPIAVITEPRRT
jgi:iron uptake system component EfeO